MDTFRYNAPVISLILIAARKEASLYIYFFSSTLQTSLILTLYITFVNIRLKFMYVCMYVIHLPSSLEDMYFFLLFQFMCSHIM